MTNPGTVALMEAAWSSIRDRFAAYELVVPGVPAFRCQPSLCNAHCCRAFSVAMDEADAERMQSESGLVRPSFLETDDGELLTLPLAHPYLLQRREGACMFLDGEDLGCEQYTGRPNACRLYPHFLLWWDSSAARVVQPADVDGRAAIVAAAGGEAGALVPLLVRHVECPGFTEGPLSTAAWRDLLQSTFRLQYPGG